MKAISSLENPRVKAAARLKRSRGRKAQARFVIYGVREVARALDCQVKLDELFLSRELLNATDFDDLAHRCDQRCEVFDLPAAVMAKLAYGERNDGVVATAFRPNLDLSRLSLPDGALVVILESMQNPGNIGAVLRSADGAGASALIVADAQCDPLHPNSIRASLGAVFSVPMAIGNTPEVLRWCTQNQLTLYKAQADAERPYTDADFTQACAVVFGSEPHGHSNQWGAAKCTPVAIPMCGLADSLNISVSAGVFLYEAKRQRSG